jgi:hypothetical protein
MAESLLDDADPAVRAWAAQALQPAPALRGGSIRGHAAGDGGGGALSPGAAVVLTGDTQQLPWPGSRAGSPPAGDSPALARGTHTPSGASPFRGGTPVAASAAGPAAPALGDVISVCVRLRALNEQEQAATGQEVAWKCGGSYMWESSAEVSELLRLPSLFCVSPD